MRSATPHVTPLSLAAVFNTRREALPVPLCTPSAHARHIGEQTILGMRWQFGEADADNVVLLDAAEITIDMAGASCRHVMVMHAVEDAPDPDGPPGSALGGLVSEYVLDYDDGESAVVPIRRRFAIQQARYNGHVASFGCVPAFDPIAVPAPHEAQMLGLPRRPLDILPTRSITPSALGMMLLGIRDGLLWVYAVENPRPEVPLRAMVCRPCDERSAIYAVSLSQLEHHPLRPGTRRKARLPLPAGLQFNRIGEIDADQIDIDLGVVISARAALDFDPAQWAPGASTVQPVRSGSEVLLEYAAHPQARLTLGDQVIALADVETSGLAVPSASRPVELTFVDAETRQPVAVRLHAHGNAGEYLPPRGYSRKVNRSFNEDRFAESAIGEVEFAYVDGSCVIDLPVGTVYVEADLGYEAVPVRTSYEIGPDTRHIEIEITRGLDWRQRGWVTSDTHVHFLSPQTALLEGRAEGVNVVNLLASQWGEMYSNVGDFDGRTTFGASDLGGAGEFLVRVGSENRTAALGHISLLGYSGPLIHPLSTGGPDESAFGDPLEVTMAEWAQRCLDQGGLVVLPHISGGRIEYAADVVLEVVNAIELMDFNPFRPGRGAPLSPYGINEWYRYLNLGYHLPVVGGSDKMNAETLLGGVRTYAHLGDRELTYDAWMDAVRAGNTFVTVGPLIEIAVEGTRPGSTLNLPPDGGSVEVEWNVESLLVPVHGVEIVVGGLVTGGGTFDAVRSARGSASVKIDRSTWIAARVRGSHHDRIDDVAAHTSAVQVLVDGAPVFSAPDSMVVLDQIQGALAYVDTLAPRPEADRFRKLRATLETAYQRLHQRMHAAGVYHHHPLHDPAQPHEH